MIEKINRTFTRLLIAILIGQLSGCGTIMHPERKGQREGSIDAGVAILDAIGLIFFILPGVVAFAVDFSNGTIYYPPSHGKASLDRGEYETTRFDPKRTRGQDIEALIAAKTGRRVRLDDPALKVSTLGSADELKARFAAL